VNHLEGHIYSNWLITDPDRIAAPPRFPVLVLIVSGGHTELLLMREHCKYERLGGTRDDAAGEAFDKVGRLLELGFPGGPAIQRAADAFALTAALDGGAAPAPQLPRAWLRGTHDFSFSGLKTAVWHMLQEMSFDGVLDEVERQSVAYAFQESVVDVLTTKVVAAAREFDVSTVCVCGGVASNRALRVRMEQVLPVPLYVPPPEFCVDNGAMIAAAAFFRHHYGNAEAVIDDPLTVDAIAGLAVPVR
jgi:N6-L-threonylcarbamoyladenine synthase